MGVIMKNKVNYTGGGGSGGASALADLEDVELTTPTDGQALVYDAENDLWINGNVSGGGGAEAGGMHVYEGAWTATASSGSGTTLTETLTLPAGYYIVVVQSPFSDSSPNIVNICLAFDGVADYTKGMATKWNHADFVAFTTVIHLTHQTAVKAVTGGSASMNWSYLERGFIKAVRLANLQTALIYSEEEREVGVWTDGKPLYQKTIVYTPSGTVTSDITLPTITNAERMMVLTAFAYKSADNRGYFIPHRDGSPLMCMLNYNNGVPVLAIRNDSWDSTWTFYITLQYTKTTDTAGSGIWTTTGEYAHHYSTTEHVIGTWIDGKPLYQQTITGTTSATGDNTILANLSGIDNVVNMTGYIKGTGRIITSYVNSSNYVSFYYSTETYNLIVWHPNSATFHGKETAVTIQYTKTTD